MSLQGKTALITGASMGIGEAIANALTESGCHLILLARSEDKLAKLQQRLTADYSGLKITHKAVDVGDHQAVDAAVAASVHEVGEIDILINNAGLALGAPAAFPDLSITDIITMNNTNINGMMFITHSVLNHSMMTRKAGTILNVTSTTALEAPPFPGEAVYHAGKACQEGFTNSLRNELSGTNIRVLALRPGAATTHFHLQRVGYDREMYDGFFEGYDPLNTEDVAQSAVYMLSLPPHLSVKALDVVSTAQRSLNVFDRTWNERNVQEQS